MDYEPTFVRIAWLNLWTKTYCILEGARCVFARDSEYLSELLSRSSTELFIHIQAIVENDSIERLKAYSAWCLWNDLRYLKEFTDEETLDGIWDLEPAKTIMEKEEELELDKLFGSLPNEVRTLDEKKAKKARFEQRHMAIMRLRRIESWLNSPELKNYHESIRRKTKGKYKFVPFFRLINGKDQNIYQRMEKIAMRFGYVTYRRGSQFIHGSSLEQFMYLSESMITPKFFGIPEKVESLAEHVGGMCDIIIPVLVILRKRIWNI